jgi:hypothetical protein
MVELGTYYFLKYLVSEYLDVWRGQDGQPSFAVVQCTPALYALGHADPSAWSVEGPTN